MWLFHEEAYWSKYLSWVMIFWVKKTQRNNLWLIDGLTFQDSVQKLEGHVQEHHSYQVCVTDMNATLDSLCKEFSSFAEKPEAHIAAEEKLQKLEVLDNVQT